MHRALAQVGAAGVLAQPQLQIEMQPKDFSRLTHGHSLSGRRPLLSEVTLRRVLVSSVAMPLSTLDSSPSRSPILCTPINDRLQAGTVIAFTRNTDRNPQESRSPSLRNVDRLQQESALTHRLRHIRGKLLIVWDGLAARRSGAVWDFVRQQRERIWIEFLPGYVPELNPVEYL